MRFPLRSAAVAFVLTLLAGCGDQSLTTPEGLTITNYPKDKPFTLTLVMESCSDSCATYEAGSCEVSIEGNTIDLDVEVPYERDDSAVCTEVCGIPVLAHCEISSLGAGTYTVRVGSFTRTITVR